MEKFIFENNKLYITNQIEEGDVLILENGNYEIIRTIDITNEVIKSTIIDPSENRSCQCEIKIEAFMKPENMENYYEKMEAL